MKKNLGLLTAALLLAAVLVCICAPASADGAPDGLYPADGEWRLYQGGQFAEWYTGLWNDPAYGWRLVGNGRTCEWYTGLWNDPNLGWWLVENGAVSFGYTGIYRDAGGAGFLIGGGAIAWDYSGLWNDAAEGWRLVNGGIADDGYNGLYCDPNFGWWLVQGGKVNFDYNGLWCDPNLGWWLVLGGRPAADYTGLYNDPNVGCWLVAGGQICFDYTGLWGDPQYGWKLIGGGTVASGYNGLWCDPNYGWWLVQNGSVAFDYTGLWNDPACGWWLIGGGTIASGYTGLWNDPVYGTWMIRDGAIDFGYTGLAYDPAAGWVLIGGGTIAKGYNGLWNDPNYGWWMIKDGAVDSSYSGMAEIPGSGWYLMLDGTVSRNYTGIWDDPAYGMWLFENGRLATNYTGFWNDGTFGVKYIAGGHAEEWNDTVEKLWNTMGEHAEQAESTYTMYVAQGLFDAMQQFSSIYPESTLLGELLVQNGGTGAHTWQKHGDTVEMTSVGYYTGYRILQLYRQGRTGELSARERRVLDEALAIAAGARGSDLEKERYIYDTLCKRVVYETDDNPRDDNDCAIGALLNGRADCDGYADAMVLCCGLAGIDCRFVDGYSLAEYRENPGDGSHMWNLVNIDGQWVMCDVTWGDYGDTSGYLYFNFGTDLAQESYLWDAGFLQTPVTRGTDFSRNMLEDQQPFIVRDAGDVYSALKSVFKDRPARVSFYCTSGPIWDSDVTMFWSMVYRAGIESYSYKKSDHMIELNGISWTKDDLIFCETDSDIITAVNNAAAGNRRNLALRLGPGLADALFANDHAGLNLTLSRTRLRDPMTYNYNTGNGGVWLDNCQYLDVYGSLTDVYNVIRDRLRGKAGSFTILIGNGLTVPKDITNTGDLDALIRSCGVENYSFSSTSENRFTISGISYYANYVLAENEQTALSYIRKVKREGKREVRIFCSDQLYAKMDANNGKGFYDLLTEAGYTGFSYYGIRELRQLYATDLQ